MISFIHVGFNSAKIGSTELARVYFFQNSFLFVGYHIIY